VGMVFVVGLGVTAHRTGRDGQTLRAAAGSLVGLTAALDGTLGPTVHVHEGGLLWVTHLQALLAVAELGTYCQLCHRCSD
jgi:hypothetical protein